MHPQSSGQVERFNGVLVSMIKNYCNLDHSNWNEFVLPVTLAYNTSVHETTGFTPYESIFGHECKLPGDFFAKVPIKGYFDEVEYLLETDKQLELIHKIISENTLKSKLRNKRNFDKKRLHIEYEVGDQVMAYYPIPGPNQSHKFWLEYNGPFSIIKKHKNGLVYEIEGFKDNGKYIYDKLHVRRIEPYYDQSKVIEEIEKRPLKSKVLDESQFVIDTISTISDSKSDSELTEIYSYLDPNEQGENIPEIVEHDNSITIESITNDDQQSDRAQVQEDRVIDIDLSQRSDSEEAPIDTGDMLADNPPVPLRRSSRIKKKPNFYQANVMLSLLIINLVSFAECSFDRTSPLIWRNTNQPVINGITRVIVNIQYESPCSIFHDSYFTQSQTFNGTDLYKWCIELFEMSFLLPTRDFCNTPIESSEIKLDINKHSKRNIPLYPTHQELTEQPERDKRVAILAIGLGVLLTIAVSSIIGISSTALSQSQSAHTELETIRKNNEILLNRVKLLSENEIKLKSVLSHLQGEISDIRNDVYQIKEAITKLKWHTPAAISYATTIASKLILYKDRIKDISRNWKKGVVDPKILEIFNFTLNCQDECPLEYAIPQSCTIDRERQILSFTFDVKNIQKDVVLLEADPFSLVHRDNNGSTICTLSWIGPQYILYSRKSDCIVPINKKVYSLHDLQILPSFENCDNPLDANITSKYYKVEKCIDKNPIQVTDIFELKNVGNQNFLYCPSLVIHIYDRDLTCPLYPFSIPTDVSFSIGNLQYRSNSFKVSSKLSYEPALSLRANIYLVPELNKLNYDQFINEKLIAEINSIPDVEIPSLGNQLINDRVEPVDVILFIIFICLLIVGYYYIRLYYKKQIHSQMLIENMRMRDIEEEGENIMANIQQELRDERVENNPLVNRPRAPINMAMAMALLLILTVVGANEQIQLNIKIVNPCQNQTRLTTQNVMLYQWCERNFQSNIIDEINSFCINHDKIFNISRDLFKQRISRSYEDNLRTITFPPIYRKIMIEQPDTSSSINVLEIANLASQFAIIKSKIAMIGKEWKRGEVNEALIHSSDLFQDLSERKFRKIIPSNCNFDKNDDSFLLKFELIDQFLRISDFIKFDYINEMLLSLMLIMVIIIFLLVYRNKKIRKRFTKINSHKMKNCRRVTFEPNSPSNYVNV